MQKILMVPVHTDALYLSRSRVVVGPTADFCDLPYYSRQENRDVNSDTPWLSDSVTSQPFENSNMMLQAGVHLHWSLPDGLCHGEVKDGTLQMPAVPNRWLIRRRKLEGTNFVEEKLWVVESDYLHPTACLTPAVNIFHQSPGEEKPYRFLGRQLSWGDWVADRSSTKHEYLKNPLTAIGYGEPTFAAYYPNCMTVFGFHDRYDDLPETWDSLQYDLVGWYGNGTTNPTLSWKPDQRSNSWIEHLRGWRVNGEQPPQTPLMCYSSIKLIKLIKSSEGTSTEPPASDKPPENSKVALGNTLSEALSALLANEIADVLLANEIAEDPAESKKKQSLVGRIEEQLEALYIHEQLSSEVQDLGLRLRRYRHEKSFDPVQGGNRWTIHADQAGARVLSEDVLQMLRSLNAVQDQYDRQVSELAQARRRLYGDWCHYMRCVYRPPDGGRGQFLDIDEIVNYIETRSRAPVESLSPVVEETRKRRSALESQLDVHITRLNLEAEQAAKTQQAQEPGIPVRPIQYSLRLEPGARFWQPTDPVVLITGGRIQINDRHGRDGRNAADGMLQCQVCETTEQTLDQVFRTKVDRDNVLKCVDDQWKHPPGADGKPGSCIGVRIVNTAQPPWNPLLLDWGIDLHPAESHAPGTSGHYDSDIITGNYVLGSQNPDLMPGNLWVNDNPDRFSGRCILGDTPSLVLRERIEDVLQQHLIDGKPHFWANPQEVQYFRQISIWYEYRQHRLPSTNQELRDLVEWYKTRPLRPGISQETRGEVPPEVRIQDPLYVTLLAYQKLFEDAEESLQPRTFLGQSLGGFNGELIQWKLGLALPIDEPIGMEPYRTFTRQVADAVGINNEWITEPTNPFSPIRSGALKLDKLRLIDSFGQVADLPCDDRVIVPTPYQTPGRPGDAFLPPRLVQPAHITFRWLDARPEEPGEMVEAAARSPICGWLLPEKLRGQLLVFAGDGNPLGALAADKTSNTLEWVRAPGFPRFNDDECEAGHKWLQSISDEYYRSATNGQNAETLRDLGELGANLQNPRLARVLLYLWATRSPKFLKCFLNTLDDAMANIDPEGTTSMGSLALLVGRPVAVVGAELDLQLKDEPAVRQDWDAFRLDQYRHDRDTDQFEQVQFRLRLGQYQSRNDGVVGYWLEESGKFAQDTFVAQAADDDDSSRRLELNVDETAKEKLKAKINAHDKGDQIDDLNFTQSVADPPLQVTLLMDPRGKAHLTTGILPVKSIDIPRSLWEPALEAMQMWFSVAPILSRPRSRRVPIPTLVDRQWSWLEQVKIEKEAIWQTLFLRPSVMKTALQTAVEELNRQLKRKDVSEFTLVVINPQITESFPNERKNLIIARKLNDQDREYRVRIFDGDGNRVAIDESLTNSALVEKLDEARKEPSKYQTQELVQEIVSTLGKNQANYALILRGSQNNEAVPSEGKSLVIARKVKPEDQTYLMHIFDAAGNKVATNDSLTDVTLVNQLDQALSEPSNCRDRDLVRNIMERLKHTYFVIDRLIEKKWLEEMEPPGDRLYVNPKEDRQSLEDWALETRLDAELSAISLALVSPGEEVDFNPGIEVREGWLLLTPGNEIGKT